jgi:organic hydroperoxide reductase OsmC/OhrA
VGEGKGTNPEELLGAAHAGCFSMALALQLTNEGFIDTEASISNVTTTPFDEYAQNAKRVSQFRESCPSSNQVNSSSVSACWNLRAQ